MTRCVFVFVVKSRFPFFDFHFGLLLLLLNMIKLERLQAYPGYEANNAVDQFVSLYDAKALIAALQGKGSRFLQRLSETRVPYFERSLVVNCAGLQLSLHVPRESLAGVLEGRFGLPAVLARTSWPNLLTLLAALLTERHLVLVHPSREVLSRLIVFLCAAIRPFAWQFPVIYFLDARQFEMMESIVPLIVGVDLPSRVFRQQAAERRLPASLLVYHAEEDRLEGPVPPVPRFGDGVAKLERRYKKAQRTHAAAGQSYAKETTATELLLKLRGVLDSALREPLKIAENKQKTTAQFAQLLMAALPGDEKFVECFAQTQMFSVFVDRERERAAFRANTQQTIVL